MKIAKLSLNGLQLLEAAPFTDERGFFKRSFAKEELLKFGVGFEVVHINHSYNKQRGTLRGMHFQNKPHEEAKIVQVLKGAIYDVVVDLRPDSPTFKKWLGVELSEENNKQLYIPKGFAHGFQTLSENTLVEYYMDEYFYPECASGINYQDPATNISWPLEVSVIAKKDRELPNLK